jgi:hypothetical protein
VSAKEGVELVRRGGEGGNAVDVPVGVLANRNARKNFLAGRIMLSSFKPQCSFVSVMHVSLTDREARLQQRNQDLLGCLAKLQVSMSMFRCSNV